MKSKMALSILVSVMLVAAGCTPAKTENFHPQTASPSPSLSSTPQPSASLQEETPVPTAKGSDTSIGKALDAACGQNFSLIVTADGRLLACGEYEKEILGQTDYVPDIQKLRLIDTGVKDCAVGKGCCAAIKADGSLYLWGTNESLGCQVTPEKILDGVQSVSLGDAFLLALKSDGALWAMGQNTYGQLGTGNTQDAPAPVEVMKDIKKACAGNGFSLILKADGTLLGCGCNLYKQFGSVSDKQAPSLYPEFPKDLVDFQSVPALLKANIADIAAGADHIAILDADGGVWCCGCNDFGQTGDNYGENTIVSYLGPLIHKRCVQLTKVLDGAQSVFAGANNTFAIKKDGSLWAWGNNGSAQLGDGTFLQRLQPVPVEGSFTAVFAGASHTLAMQKDGSLWAWGRNASGQLCNQTTSYTYNYAQVADHVVEAASSGYTTLIVKDDGTLLGCGYNNYSQLADSTGISSSAFKEILKDALHAAVGSYASYCVKKDGSLWAWGNNEFGDVGNGNTEEVEHTFAYQFFTKTDNDRKVPAGYREFLAEPLKNYDPVKILEEIVQVAAINRTALALTKDGTLYGWGQSIAASCFGVKGGPRGCLASPAAVTGEVQSILNMEMLSKTNGELWDWGVPLTGDGMQKAVKEPVDGAVSAVSGYQLRIAVKSDGTLWYWGNANGTSTSEPIQIDDHIRSVTGDDTGIMLVKDDGTLYEVLSYNLSDYLSTYEPGKKLTEHEYVDKVMDGVRTAFSVASDSMVDGSSNFVLKTDGTLWAAGNDKYGQLGDGKVFFTPQRISGN